MLLKPYQNIEEEGTLTNSFYEATITMIPKPEKDTNQKKRKENYRAIYLKLFKNYFLCHDSQHYPDWKHLLDTDIWSWLSDILEIFCAFR